MEAPRG
ncbi:hypothetical protein CPC197_1815, partial [Chlamydia psittaci C1/97]